MTPFSNKRIQSEISRVDFMYEWKYLLVADNLTLQRQLIGFNILFTPKLMSLNRLSECWKVHTTFYVYIIVLMYYWITNTHTEYTHSKVKKAMNNKVMALVILVWGFRNKIKKKKNIPIHTANACVTRTRGNTNTQI